MYFFNFIVFCVLAIINCVAEEDPLFSNTDLYDPSVFSDFSLLTDSASTTDSGDPDGTPPADLFAPSSDTWNNDNNDSPSIFADSTGGCSQETSQLTNKLRSRGAVNACEDPQGSGLYGPSINPKVAPFINIETMEMQKICPGQLTSLYDIAVCSSGVNGDILLWHGDSSFDLLWAERSKLSYAFEV